MPEEGPAVGKVVSDLQIQTKNRLLPHPVFVAYES